MTSPLPKLTSIMPAWLWDKTGSVQRSGQSATASHKNTATYADVSGLTGIACCVMPIKGGVPGLFELYPGATNRIQLKGAYPAIDPTMFFLVGTTRYKIFDASTDGDGDVTTLITQQMEGVA